MTPSRAWSTRTVGFLLAAIYLAFLHIAECATDDCSQYTNCVQCDRAFEAYCGWCETTNKCLKGTPAGPNESGACPPSKAQGVSSWRWDTYACNEYICQGIYNCEDCVRTIACGWCEGSSSCQFGNENDTAPLYPQATCGNWVKKINLCGGNHIVLGLTLWQFILLVIGLPVLVVTCITLALCICFRKRIKYLRTLSTVQFSVSPSALSPRSPEPPREAVRLLGKHEQSYSSVDESSRLRSVR